jgi:hypothetical protein
MAEEKVSEEVVSEEIENKTILPEPNYIDIISNEL